MIFSWRWLLVAFALVVSCETNFAAGSAKEERAYAAAVGAFQDEMYDRAETLLAQFTQKYPNSSHIAEAGLLQAQAEFKQGKLTEAIARLTTGQTKAGKLADEYIYWIGEAQFQGSNYVAAAETFNSLAQDFPDSRLRLNAAVEAASAFSRAGDPASVVEFLQDTNGFFQQAAKLDPKNELVVRGWLLLAQAQFEQEDFAGEFAVLTTLAAQKLKPELNGQRAYLLYANRLAAGDFAAALVATTNLTEIARLAKDGGLRAEGAAARATVLAQMGRTDEAMAAFQENLTPDVPVAQQRQAVLKVAELGIAQKQFTVATNALEKFLAQFPGSPSADITLLTLGELHLKEFVAQPAFTNHLAEAQLRFNQFIGTFTNSIFLGKAYLDRGWCGALAGKTNESLADFKTATQMLPPSEDLAVARFKLGDALFVQKDFAGALTNYQSVVDDFTKFPAVAGTLVEQALYQSLRASLELKDMKSADAALSRILQLYPAGDLTDNAILLVGEGVAEMHRPVAARALFQKFEAQFPDSELRPQAQLAIARTYEQEQNWTNAIQRYIVWQQNFPTNELRPQVDYALALANFQSGNETNAFGLFTNFVAQFPTNDLAARVQWWVADYFFRNSDFVSAERNYKYVFQNWPASDLANQARLMAGRAAVARSDYAGGVSYFSKLEVDTNCPVELRVQATFAHGDALMRSDSTDTNNPLANFQAATGVFGQIVQLYPTNEWGALASFYIGECDVQLANYDAATNAYAQVFNSPAADIAARSQAKIGFGIALEKKAALATGDQQAALLKLARDNYLDVFDTSTGTHLRDGEVADDFWVKKAGLQALPLIQQLGGSNRDQVNGFIDHMERLFPQAKESLEKKRAALLSGKM
jgi:TolA-binding protein